MTWNQIQLVLQLLLLLQRCKMMDGCKKQENKKTDGKKKKKQENNKNVWIKKSYIPVPGIEPGPPGWKPRILTTRPHRNMNSSSLHNCSRVSWANYSVCRTRILYNLDDRGRSGSNLGVILVPLCEPVFWNLPQSYTWSSKNITYSYTWLNKIFIFAVCKQSLQIG